MKTHFEMTKEMSDRIIQAKRFMNFNDWDLKELPSNEIPMFEILLTTLERYGHLQEMEEKMSRLNEELESLRVRSGRTQSELFAYETVLSQTYGKNTIDHFLERIERKKKKADEKHEKELAMMKESHRKAREGEITEEAVHG